MSPPVGLKKGYITEQRPNDKVRPARMKGRLSKRVKLVRSLITEVAGMSPYEKRIRDIIVTGGTTAEKRAYKFAKNRLGTHKRANKKKEMIKDTWIRGAGRA
mmetsp:Transcript_12553/g.23170  ORF Transcript_12553/g.23170 Transcript_12553/m.23170 type:complete len:102 (+) Transcript_12553:3-308(+)